MDQRTHSTEDQWHGVDRMVHCSHHICWHPIDGDGVGSQLVADAASLIVWRRRPYRSLPAAELVRVWFDSHMAKMSAISGASDPGRSSQWHPFGSYCPVHWLGWLESPFTILQRSNSMQLCEFNATILCRLMATWQSITVLVLHTYNLWSEVQGPPICIYDRRWSRPSFVLPRCVGPNLLHCGTRSEQLQQFHCFRTASLRCMPSDVWWSLTVLLTRKPQ